MLAALYQPIGEKIGLKQVILKHTVLLFRLKILKYRCLLEKQQLFFPHNT
jgi:hypothetical protein